MNINGREGLRHRSLKRHNPVGVVYLIALFPMVVRCANNPHRVFSLRALAKQ
jgi:hypothetical protein